MLTERSLRILEHTLTYPDYNFHFYSGGDAILYTPLGKRKFIKLDKVLFSKINRCINSNLPLKSLADTGECDSVFGLSSVADFLVSNGNVFVARGRTNEPVRTRAAMPDTLTVWLHLTSACNFACSYCFVEKSDKQLTHDDLATFAGSLRHTCLQNNIKRLYVKVAGGEPLLSMELLNLSVQKIRDAFLGTGVIPTFTVFTNGYCLSKEAANTLQTLGIVNLAVSVDGDRNSNSATRRTISGEDAYDIIMSNLDNLGDNFRVSLLYTITEANLNGLKSHCKNCWNRGFSASYSLVRQTHRPDREFAKSLKRSLKDLLEYIKQHHMLGSTNFLGLNPLFPRTYNCNGGWNYLALTSNATASFCHEGISRGNSYCFQVTNKMDLIAKAANSFKGFQTLKNSCYECKWRWLCSGGCHFSKDATGNFSYCQVMKIVLPMYMKHFAEDHFDIQSARGNRGNRRQTTDTANI